MGEERISVLRDHTALSIMALFFFMALPFMAHEQS